MKAPLRLPGVRRIIHRRRLASTQTLARRLADEGAPAWTLVWADRQTRGRGRMDRRWSSAEGGLYFSLILRPRVAPAELARMSVQAGRACARTLGKLSGLRMRVKLPNDVLAVPPGQTRPSKLCGILIEASGTQHELHWMVIGIGVNVNNPVPASMPEAAFPPASIRGLTGRQMDVRSVLRSLAAALTAMWGKC